MNRGTGPAGIRLLEGGPRLLTQGAEGSPGTEGAPPGFDIKQGGLGSAAQALALATLCGVLFLTFLDNTVVSVGLANVQSDLHAGVTSLQWVVNGYALTFASFMLVAGMLGDIFGRKRIMLIGVAVFCGGSVVAATASNVDWLIAGRVIMGIGAAASEPGTLSIIRHVYPDRKTRADALGIWAAVSGLALALGPVIGGVLVGFSSWRAIFWFNLGFGLVAFVLAAVAVPETSDRQGRRIDVLGFIFGAAFLACLSFAVIQGETSGYTATWIVGALRCVCCLRHRVRHHGEDGQEPHARPVDVPPPTLCRLQFRRIRRLLRYVLHLLLHCVVPPGRCRRLGVSDGGGLPPDGGRADHRVRPHRPAGGTGRGRAGRWPSGCLLAGGGILVANAVLSPTVDFATLGWVLPLAGIGIGMLLVPVTSVPLTVVPPERSGMAASATNTSREMGAVFGVAILGSIVNAKLTGDLAARLKAIGIPPNFQSLVEHAIQTGGASQGGAASRRRTQQERGCCENRHEGGQRRLQRIRVRAPRGAAPVRLPDPGRRRGGGLDDPSQARGDLRALARSAVHAEPSPPPAAATGGSVRVDSGRKGVERSHGPTAAARREELGTLQHPLVREDRDVGEAHGRHGAVELASERSRSDTDAFADGKRPRHEEHESRKDVAGALLCCDAEDTRDGTARTRTRVGSATAIRFRGPSLMGPPRGLHAPCPPDDGQQQGR